PHAHDEDQAQRRREALRALRGRMVPERRARDLGGLAAALRPRPPPAEPASKKTCLSGRANPAIRHGRLANAEARRASPVSGSSVARLLTCAPHERARPPPRLPR